ncbi:MAG: hypothetical protein QGF68_14135, partial [Nitrospinota bacterium]|nr:hypothetical protein [Nitrospinota bacterium]
MALPAGQVGFLALPEEPNGPAGQPSHQGQVDLHRDPVFRAEPAADGGGPHADLLHRDTERPGDLAAVGEGVLGPGFHNQDVGARPPPPPPARAGG